MPLRLVSCPAWCALALVVLAAGGCAAGIQPATSQQGVSLGVNGPVGDVPRELDMMSLPAYKIEPPDILLIDAVKVVPKPPYTIEPLDVLQIVVEGTLLDQPIAGPYAVDPDGTVNLGPSYGVVKLAGQTIEEAIRAIDRHLRRALVAPQVSLSLIQSAGQQQIQGEHLVGPDGTINLGTYGKVYVANMTEGEARAAIERHLSQYLDGPEVSVAVFAYNSKVYYVITAGAGLGDSVARFPITGNETVLDAIAQINGLSRLSSKTIWIARPAPAGLGCDQILPVNWEDIAMGASTATNYQVLPRDRIFIAEDRLVALDSMLSKLISPFERVFGFTLLSSQTIQNLQSFPEGQNRGF